MKINSVFITAGIIILLIFLAGCTSSASTAKNVNPGSVVMEVGPTPTLTPIPHSIVGTWKVDYNGHKGTVRFTSDGYTNIDVSGYPGLSTPYSEEGNNVYFAKEFIYSVQFKYNKDGDTITSDQYPGIVLTRLE